MNLIIKALAIGFGVFVATYLCGWYIAQEPNVAEWSGIARYFHTAISVGSVIMTFIFGYIK